ncbi:MAG: NAD(+)/NADH kinase [Melioribacteraceae bacterium]|nr:NAD(+)/NADH kinase [Melioribacteraceae bacterium]
MKLGIVPNISKSNIVIVVLELIKKLTENNISYLISNQLLNLDDSSITKIDKSVFADNKKLYADSDIIVSIGGDGTMLTTAYEARDYATPLAGVNFGKLGFLAEFEISNIDGLINDIKTKNYIIEDRMVLEAKLKGNGDDLLYAINDIVIDKGRWPKMIELTIKIDNDYVSKFSADGVIIATPTGSTGYSLSANGPIVTPNSDVITINPISPHTLTMRPLIIPSDQKIEISINSPDSKAQINCDGQRVNLFDQPVTLEVYKSENPVKLIHSKSTSYFEILRKKLFWGIDSRKPSN